MSTIWRRLGRIGLGLVLIGGSYTVSYSQGLSVPAHVAAAFINEKARDISAESGPEIADIEVVRQVVHAAKQRPSKITRNLREWYAGEIEPGEMMRRIIDAGYVTNFRFRQDGGDFLLPTDSQRPSAGSAVQSLQTLFQDLAVENLTAPWVIDEDSLMMAGFATGGVPVLNIARVETFYQHIQRGFDAHPDARALVSRDVVAELIIANEMTHAYLYDQLSLSIDQNTSKAQFIKTAVSNQLINTRQLHEFISDAASINTDGLYLFLQWMILPTRLESVDGVVRVRQDDPYAYTLQFLANQLEQKLAARGKPFNLHDTHSQYLAWMTRLRTSRNMGLWQENWNGFERWLEGEAARIYVDLGPDGIKALQDAYVTETKELMPVINSFASL